YCSGIYRLEADAGVLDRVEVEGCLHT
ncbi:hypothetical protein A2U01_0007912, partial [Trifolium medium]|nr:hypothetical protein [Trifolium medium]